MLDTGRIGTAFAPFEVTASPFALRLFARAIGEPDPAIDAPLPPTFLFCMEFEREDPLDTIALFGVPENRVLHAEQHFEYHHAAHAGDRLCFHASIADVYSKKGGELDFIVRQTRVERMTGEAVAELRTVLVVRNEP